MPLITSGSRLIRHRASSSFSPSDLANLALWLKADALSLNDGDAVSTWTDSSGNGRNATGTDTARPLYKANILNGLPVVRFDGSNDQLVTASFAAKTLFVVANYTETATFTGYPSPISRKTTSDDSSIQGSTGTKTYRGIANNRAAMYINNTTTLTVSDLAAYLVGCAILVNAITDQWNIGNEVNSNRFWGGDVAEVILYGTALSDTDRGKVQTYLGTKYAIALA